MLTACKYLRLLSEAKARNEKGDRMCESVPLKAPQRRRSDSTATDPARLSSALKKSSEAGRSNENKHIGRTERLHFLLYADRNWVRRS